MSAEAVQVCPYCRSGFEADEAVTVCPSCGTPHHADCFAENGGCTIFGCAAAPAEEAKISVGATDLHAMPPMMGTQGAAIQPVSPPPPPLPSGSVAPPPLAVHPYGWPGHGAGGTVAAPYYPGYSYGGQARPKSRVAFVLLAVFLGSFGAHNFYAGYNKKAAVQLCLTIFTCFWASLITWIWAIVEACTVTRDDDGVLLS